MSVNVVQAGPGPDSAGACGHEGEDRPRHRAPDPADVPEVLPRPAAGQLTPVCREGVGRGEKGEHGSGARISHVLQVLALENCQKMWSL